MDQSSSHPDQGQILSFGLLKVGYEGKNQKDMADDGIVEVSLMSSTNIGESPIITWTKILDEYADSIPRRRNFSALLVSQLHVINCESQ